MYRSAPMTRRIPRRQLSQPIALVAARDLGIPGIAFGALAAAAHLAIRLAYVLGTGNLG